MVEKDWSLMDAGVEAQIPEVGLMEIRRIAQKFYDEYWESGYMGIDDVCDKMGVGIVFVRGLAKEFGLEAYMTNDFCTIVIDERFADDAKVDFLIAHELGHLVMHKEFYPSNIYGLDEYLGYVTKYVNGAAEVQADVFAKELLKMRRNRYGMEE